MRLKSNQTNYSDITSQHKCNIIQLQQIIIGGGKKMSNAIKINVDTTEITECIDKVKELIELLEKAKSLVDDLALCKIEIGLKMDV